MPLAAPTGRALLLSLAGNPMREHGTWRSRILECSHLNRRSITHPCPDEGMIETVASPCPICQATHEYDAALIGRYTSCLSCGARFYVEVPSLAASQGEPGIAGQKITIP